MPIFPFIFAVVHRNTHNILLDLPFRKKTACFSNAPFRWFADNWCSISYTTITIFTQCNIIELLCHIIFFTHSKHIDTGFFSAAFLNLFQRCTTKETLGMSVNVCFFLQFSLCNVKSFVVNETDQEDSDGRFIRQPRHGEILILKVKFFNVWNSPVKDKN